MSKFMHTNISQSRTKQNGVSLIELLVAVSIGLLGTIVIFTVFRGADGYKRTTVGIGDAQTNGAVALFTLERYIRSSGSSVATTNVVQQGATIIPALPNLLLGCPLVGLPNAAVITGPVAATTAPIAPVRIIDGSLTPGGSGFSSDVIVVMGGNADIATNPTRAAPVALGATSISAVANTYGWRAAAVGRPADIAALVVSSQVVASTVTVSPVACSMRRLAAVSSPSGSGVITLAAGTPIGYTQATNLHNFGPSPYMLSIGVNARQELVETNFTGLLTGESAIPVSRVIADGIVSIQAQYGIDNNQDDVIDEWVEPTGVWANPTNIDPAAVPTVSGNQAINKIKAIRLAVLARSVHYEPPNRNLSPRACDATAAVATWRLLPAVAAIAGVAPVTPALAQPQSADILPAVIAAAPSTATGANWQCFRYRSFETVIPVINMIKSPL
jgi:type IV pilus assembly protein PilW